MDVLDDLPAEVTVATACRALGARRATLYRRTFRPRPSTPRAMRSPRRLSKVEREQVRELLNEEPFVDQPPTEVYATLLSPGRYLCSVRTMYRLLASDEATKDRRRQRFPHRHDSPRHARGWLASFFDWYNEEHHHEGLALFTRAEVFFGRVDEVTAQRQVALDAAHRAHPERLVRGRPVVARPPWVVTINHVPMAHDFSEPPVSLALAGSGRPPEVGAVVVLPSV